jgi:hypothetical protein
MYRLLWRMQDADYTSLRRARKHLSAPEYKNAVLLLYSWLCSTVTWGSSVILMRVAIQAPTAPPTAISPPTWVGQWQHQQCRKVVHKCIQDHEQERLLPKFLEPREVATNIKASVGVC